MQQHLLKLYSKAKNNLFILILFIASSAFLVLQHIFYWNWDFSVYVMNAQHFFSNGPFLEIARAPLSSLLMGLLHYITGWKLAEFAYIILVSGLFCFSSVKIADAFNLDRRLFYALELSPFLLLNGTFVGTELLSLSLLQIGLAYLKKPQAGLAFGFAALARYNDLLFAPILLLKKKNLIPRVLLCALPILVWLAFNYFVYGSPWASIADAYAVNVMFRNHRFGSILFDFFVVIGWYLPFLILGIKDAKKENWKINWLLGIFTLIAIASYLKIPHMEARYLFNLTLPVAYFAALCLKRFDSKKILMGIVIANFAIAAAAMPFSYMEPVSSLNAYKNAASDVNCACASNAWVGLNYMGKVCEPAPSPALLGKYIEEGYNIAHFKAASEPIYNYNNSIVLKDAPQYVVLGSNSSCKEPYQEMNKTFLQGMAETGISLSYCEVFFGSLCSKVNL